ncbi:tail fiber assembly protein [Serratia marcescens]|uniref:tail fiber assembly protein n=1 Tax=Serratia marcescens TaxID=615 RepID=UPI003D7B760C
MNINKTTEDADMVGPHLEETKANYYFSPSELVFLAGVMKKDYVIAGSWPQDAKPIPDALYERYAVNPPEGMLRGADVNGDPCWLKAPPPTKDELSALASRKKDRCMQQAESRIAPLARAARLGIATEREKTALTQWETYSVLLNRIDPAAAPDIAWPEVPGVA